jgi:hypothetical protein
VYFCFLLLHPNAMENLVLIFLQGEEILIEAFL